MLYLSFSICDRAHVNLVNRFPTWYLAVMMLKFDWFYPGRWSLDQQPYSSGHSWEQVFVAQHACAVCGISGHRSIRNCNQDQLEHLYQLKTKLTNVISSATDTEGEMMGSHDHICQLCLCGSVLLCSTYSSAYPFEGSRSWAAEVYF